MHSVVLVVARQEWHHRCPCLHKVGSDRQVAEDAAAETRQIPARALAAYLSKEGMLLAGLGAVEATGSWLELAGAEDADQPWSSGA